MCSTPITSYYGMKYCVPDYGTLIVIIIVLFSSDQVLASVRPGFLVHVQVELMLLSSL